MVSEPHKAQRPPGLRHLPPQPTSFVGRGEELAEIAELLALVAHHPASEREAVERARRLLDPCEAQLEPARFAGAVQRSELDDLASAVTAAQAQLAATAGEAAVTLPEPAGQSLVEPLTPREMEVLGLIAEGLPNRAIARELVLAIGTVKWYTGQIYGKLGVSNRTQAVARARER